VCGEKSIPKGYILYNFSYVTSGKGKLMGTIKISMVVRVVIQ
jgi:hypothetical protein